MPEIKKRKIKIYKKTQKRCFMRKNERFSNLSYLNGNCFVPLFKGKYKRRNKRVVKL